MHITKYTLLLGTILALTCVGCRESEEVKPVPDYVPVQTAKDGKWGMLAPDGRLLFADKFEAEPSLALEGAFSVKNGDNYDLYRAEANPAKINKKPLVAVGNYADGIVPATCAGERIKLLDKQGEAVAELMPVDGAELVKCDIAFRCGLLVVTTPDGKFGYVNKKGKPVVKPIYDAALPFADGYAMVAKVADPNNPAASLSVSIIDTKGKEVLAVEPRYTVIDLDTPNKRLIVNDINGRMGFLTFDDKFEQLPASVKNIGQIADDCFVYANENGLCGVMDFKYKVVLEPKYQQVEIVESGRYIATTGPEWDLVDNSGQPVVKFGQATLVGYLKGFGFMAYDKVTSRLLGDDGKQKGNLSFFGVGLNASACSSVRSDYQSEQRIAEDLASLPSPAGIAHFPWNTEASKIAPAPDAATGVYAAMPQASVSGVDYLLNAVAVFSAPVGSTTLMPDQTGEIVEGFDFNPNAGIQGVDFYFRSEAAITEGFVAKIKACYAKAGFKQTSSPVDTSKSKCFVLESAASTAIFCVPVGGHDMNFFIYSRSNSELGQRWLTILSKAAAAGGVPNAEELFGVPASPEQVDADYVDRSSRDSLSTVDSGQRVSSRL